MAKAKYVVARASEIPPGGRKLVEARGRPIAVFNLGGEFFGVLDRCPHQGGSLCAGRLVGLVEAGSEPGEYRYSRPGEILRCPWHGWEFDLRTGKSRCEPDRLRATRYDVGVEDGAALAEGPYVAETFEVTVESDYVVVEV